MNDRRACFYPAMAYASLLVMVWGLSWLNSMFSMFSGIGDGAASLVSAEGVRWAVRNSTLALNSLPWGTIVLVIAIVGLLRGSGLKKAATHLFGSGLLTANERRALFFAFIAFLSCIAILFAVTVAPWQLLMGVTGDLAGSPVMQGWLSLFSFIVFIVSLVYGFIYGNYRSLLDLVYSVGDTFVDAVPALIALIPAAGIIPCVEYMGLFDFFGTEEEEILLLSDILYSIPFLYIIMLHLLEKERV